MPQPHNKAIPVNYLIFEDNTGVRYLSPEIKLLENALHDRTFSQIDGLKTVKTISYLAGHKNAGNLFDLIDIKSETGSIQDCLEKYGKNIIKTINNVNHLLGIKNSVPKSPHILGTKNPILKTTPIKPISITKSNPGITIADSFGEGLEEIKNEISNHIVLMPLPFNINVPEGNTNRENSLLQDHLNYYLSKLGLFQIKDIKNYRIFDLSTLGDKQLGIDLILKHNVLAYNTNTNIIHSNKFQQFVLASLGFIEFLYVPEHLAGTFLEAIYFIACLQNNEDIKNKILNISVNHLEDKTEYKLPEFISIKKD